MKFPKDTDEQYWHCRAMQKGYNYPFSNYDLCFTELYEHIIHPYIEFQELIIGGQRFKNRDEIEQIRIVWTPKSQKTYPEKRENGYGNFHYVTSSEDHCLGSGKEFTSALLTIPQKKTEKSGKFNTPLVSIANINDNNNVNVNVNSIAINNEKFEILKKIRDMFDDFRAEVLTNESESKKMKEIQDDLDEINHDTTNKEASGVIVKLKRFLKKGLDKTSEFGMKVCASALATKLLQEINELSEQLS